MLPRKTSLVRTSSARLPGALLALLVVCSLAVPARASFEDLPTGARQAGLGNSFTAIADDVYSTYYNPAGLAQIHRSEFTAYYARLYAGLTDNSNISRSYLAYAHPTQTRGTLGLSYTSLSLAGLYSESAFGVSYAYGFREKWNLGGTVKFLRKTFGSDSYTQNAINTDTGASLGGPDPLFAQNGTSKSAASFDLGAQYRLSRIYGLGFAILNANEPNMALSPSDTDKVAAVYKMGIARRAKTSAIDAEISWRKFTSDELRFNAGAERWFGSGIAIRGGLGFGQRGYQVTSLGFSYRWENIDVSYALIYPLVGVKGTFGTNQFSLTFRFGRKN